MTLVLLALAALPAFADHAADNLQLRDVPAGSVLIVRNSIDLRSAYARVTPGLLADNGAAVIESVTWFSNGMASSGGAEACTVREFVVEEGQLLASIPEGEYTFIPAPRQDFALTIVRSHAQERNMHSSRIVINDGARDHTLIVWCPFVTRYNAMGERRHRFPMVGTLRRALGWANVMLRLPEGVPGYETALREAEEERQAEFEAWENSRFIPWF